MKRSKAVTFPKVAERKIWARPRRSLKGHSYVRVRSILRTANKVFGFE